MTNWSVSTFKGKLKLFRLKIVKYKTRAFSRKIEIKPFSIVYFAYREQSLLILLSVIRVGFYAQFHRLCEENQEARVALGYASGNSYASFVLSKLPKCSITR